MSQKRWRRREKRERGRRKRRRRGRRKRRRRDNLFACLALQSRPLKHVAPFTLSVTFKRQKGRW